MARHKNKDWNLSGSEENGRSKDVSAEHLPVAVLMDIRDELQVLNRLLACPNFIDIPNILRAIRRNTTKPRRKKRGQ
jgi:hypothetical protein